MAGPGAFITEEGAEFDKRLRMAIRALDHELKPASIAMGEPARCGVYLAQFATWVRDVVQWDAPGELTALAGPPAVETMQPESGVEPGALLWTPERKAEARAMRDKLKNDGARDFAAQTAKHFEVSTARLRKILSEGDAAKPWPPFNRT
jgi:hypothetical protein